MSLPLMQFVDMVHRRPRKGVAYVLRHMIPLVHICCSMLPNSLFAWILQAQEFHLYGLLFHITQQGICHLREMSISQILLGYTFISGTRETPGCKYTGT